MLLVYEQRSSLVAKLFTDGVEMILYRAETELAEKHAQKVSKEEYYTYVSPYNGPGIVSGRGKINYGTTSKR